MSAWPIEELLFRPIATVMLAALVPVVTRKLLVTLLAPKGVDPSSRGMVARAFDVLVPIEGVGFGFLGYTALPRALGGGAGFDAVDALFCAAVAVAVGLLRRRALVPAATSTVSSSPKGSAGAGAGLLVGFALLAIGILMERGTRISADGIVSTSADTAWRRLRIDPRDGRAMLAVAWSSADRDDLEEATLRIDEAERMGAPAAELREARAEVAAKANDCAGAWTHFDEALRLRAEAAFERGELPELGGYHLPPAMVTRCTPREGAEPFE